MGISFFVIALVLLSITIYTIYLFLSVFFPANKLAKGLVLFGLILSCVGFIALMVLVRATSSLVVHFFYVIFSLILGFLFYLTIFAILFYFIKLFKIKFNHLLFVKIGTFLAVILLL